MIDFLVGQQNDFLEKVPGDKPARVATQNVTTLSLLSDITEPFLLAVNRNRLSAAEGGAGVKYRLRRIANTVCTCFWIVSRGMFVV